MHEIRVKLTPLAVVVERSGIVLSKNDQTFSVLKSLIEPFHKQGEDMNASSVGRAPEAGSASAVESARIAAEVQQIRESSFWWIKDSSQESGMRKIKGSDLQELIYRTREDEVILEEEGTDVEWRRASLYGFNVPEMVQKGVVTSLPSVVAPVTSPDEVPHLNPENADKRSPAEIALEQLPDKDLFDLAVSANIDLPADAFDRNFTIQALLKAGYTGGV